MGENEDIEIDIQDMTSDFLKKQINWRSKATPYSMFKVGRSMFDVQFVRVDRVITRLLVPRPKMCYPVGLISED